MEMNEREAPAFSFFIARSWIDMSRLCSPQLNPEQSSATVIGWGLGEITQSRNTDFRCSRSARSASGLLLPNSIICLINESGNRKIGYRSPRNCSRLFDPLLLLAGETELNPIILRRGGHFDTERQSSVQRYPLSRRISRAADTRCVTAAIAGPIAVPTLPVTAKNMMTSPT